MRKHMDFSNKTELAFKELENTKIWKSSYNPPYLGLLSLLGLRLRPPHYNSIIVNFLTMSSGFGIPFGSIMWFRFWQSEGMPFSLAIIISLVAGILSGTTMSLYFKISATRNKLSNWNDFTK